jgi:hypothetical protein
LADAVSAVEGSKDGAEGVRRVKWMTGEAGWEVISMYSEHFSSVLRKRRAFSWSAAKAEGVDVRIEIASDAATASIAGRAAEKTKEVPLMR